MDTLPLSNQTIAMLCDLGNQVSYVRLLDSDDADNLRMTGRTKQIDLRQAWSNDMNMRRLVVLGMDDNPEAECTMNHDHGPV